MGFVDLTQVLGAPQLCGLVQKTKTGIPDVFPPGFFNRDGQAVEKDYGTYIRVTGTRTMARQVAYGGPAVRRQMRNVEEVPVKLIHTHEELEVPVANFRGLFKKDAQGSNLLIDEKGADEVARQI